MQFDIFQLATQTDTPEVHAHFSARNETPFARSINPCPSTTASAWPWLQPSGACACKVAAKDAKHGTDAEQSDGVWRGIGASLDALHCIGGVILLCTTSLSVQAAHMLWQYAMPPCCWYQATLRTAMRLTMGLEHCIQLTVYAERDFRQDSNRTHSPKAAIAAPLRIPR